MGGDFPAEINGVPRDEIESTLRHRIAYTALSRVGRDLECEVAMVAWATLQLADATIANLSCSVEDKARYANEPSLVARLEYVIALCDRAA